MQKIIFDSSFLMSVAERPTPWQEDIAAFMGGFEPVILSCVKVELERRGSGRGKRSRFARLALEFSQGFKVEKCGDASVDDEIASAAQSQNAAVATVDRELIRTLRSLGVQVVSLRSWRASLA